MDFYQMLFIVYNSFVYFHMHKNTLTDSKPHFAYFYYNNMALLLLKRLKSSRQSKVNEYLINICT